LRSWETVPTKIKSSTGKGERICKKIGEITLWEEKNREETGETLVRGGYKEKKKEKGESQVLEKGFPKKRYSEGGY